MSDLLSDMGALEVALLAAGGLGGAFLLWSFTVLIFSL